MKQKIKLMKKILSAIFIAMALVSCTKNRIVSVVTYTNGQKDTIVMDSYKKEPYLEEGDFSRTQGGYVIVSGVRSYKVLSVTPIEKRKKLTPNPKQ